jgi:hypothetical protein
MFADMTVLVEMSRRRLSWNERGAEHMLNHPRLFFLFSLFVLWLSAQIGAFVRKWRALKEDERDNFGVVQVATLTLLGLIIGFSFSMAVSRYDLRKSYEEAEANAIGTEYVRVGLYLLRIQRGCVCC